MPVPMTPSRATAARARRTLVRVVQPRALDLGARDGLGLGEPFGPGAFASGGAPFPWGASGADVGLTGAAVGALTGCDVIDPHSSVTERMSSMSRYNWSRGFR